MPEYAARFDRVRPAAAGDTSFRDELRRVLGTALSRISAERVLERACQIVGVSEAALRTEHAEALARAVSVTAGLYLTGPQIRALRREIRALGAGAGGRSALVASGAAAPRRCAGGGLFSVAQPGSVAKGDPARPGAHPGSTDRMEGSVESEQAAAREVCVPVREERDVEDARQAALRQSAVAGLRHVDGVKVATVVSELARNIIAYAGEGEIHLSAWPGPKGRVVLRAVDNGPGIRDLQSILAGRYRSKTGLGLGLMGSARLMDRFDVQTSEGSGTVITAEKRV